MFTFFTTLVRILRLNLWYICQYFWFYWFWI